MSELSIGEWKRLSGRSYDQFKKDIFESTKDERIIIELYAKYCKDKHGVIIDIKDNGIDNTGEFLELSKVRKDADFIVNGHLVEVKTIREKLNSFRLKVYSIKSYIKQKANMLLVSGWKTDNPEFTIITPKLMRNIMKEKPIAIARDWENKRIIRLEYDDFKWVSLTGE